MNSAWRSWGTTSEIDFLRNCELKSISRLEFLQNYKEGMKLRSNWGNIDPNVIQNVVDYEIKQLKEHENGRNN